MLSLWRGAIFRKNGMTRPGAQNGAQNDPNRAPNDPQRPSNDQKDRFKSALDVWPNFSFYFDALGKQNGSKKHPKIDFGVPEALRGFQGTLREAVRSF